MAKRRANGEGSIRKRSDGRWEGRYTVGYDPETGKQKFKNVKTVLKDEKLIITVDASQDITLEKGLLARRAHFFEEVFSVQPVIRQRG